VKGPSEAERMAEVVSGVFTIVAVIVLAIWTKSVLSIIFASVVTTLMAAAFIRSRGMSEEEMLRRQDLAIGKPCDDPKEMARWVP
jgi:hypothetical protein